MLRVQRRCGVSECKASSLTVKMPAALCTLPISSVGRFKSLGAVFCPKVTSELSVMKLIRDIQLICFKIIN